ncbi:MAG TPA: N4-gp56 family major capsid protein [Syntrophales bacterium]|nr:N4-gp56 family major capsid protein [Syntrophales bacterium]HRV28387.1 N4-gp56 family major capsid protein [Spirochaetia bacterium]
MEVFKKVLPLNIQFFADGDMNTQKTTTEGLSPGMKTYYEKRLLKNTKANLVHQQFADTYPIPRGNGKTIELRKFTPLPKALTPITEATVPAGRGMTEEPITITVDQYGDYISTSDMLELTHFDSILDVRSELQGNQAGETIDTIVREVMNGGSNVLYAPKVDSNGAETSVTARHVLDESAKMTVKMIRAAANQLKRKNVPKIDGSYVAIMHPDTTTDLQNDQNFVEAVKYGRPEDLYTGEIGKLAGVRIVESSEAKIFWGENLTAASRTLTVKDAVAAPGKTINVKEAITADEAAALAGRDIIIEGNLYTIDKVTAGTANAASITLTDNIAAVEANKVIYPGEGASAGKAAYSSLFLGANAYATTEIEGGGLEFIVKPKGYADALNLRSASGWKCTLAAKLLDESRIVRVEHCTSMSSLAVAN